MDLWYSSAMDSSLQVHTLALRMANAYLLEFPSGLLLVDTGAPGSARIVLRSMQEIERDDLRLIYITHAHYDHYGSAAELRRLTGASLAVHPGDAAAMAAGLSPLGSARGRGRPVQAFTRLFSPWLRLTPAPPDLSLAGGQDLASLGFPATIIHTPGHTPGSSCLLVMDRLAFVGDLLSTSRRPHLQRYYASDWNQLPGSLARLQALHPELVYPGHGNHPLDGASLQRLRAE